MVHLGGREMSGRPTPETDTETMRDEYDHVDTDLGPFAPSDTVPADFARRLERERDEALSDLEFRRGLYKVLEEANNRLRASNKEAVALARTLKQERDEARERAAKLAAQLLTEMEGAK